MSEALPQSRNTTQDTDISEVSPCLKNLSEDTDMTQASPQSRSITENTDMAEASLQSIHIAEDTDISEVLPCLTSASENTDTSQGSSQSRSITEATDMSEVSPQSRNITEDTDTSEASMHLAKDTDMSEVSPQSRNITENTDTSEALLQSMHINEDTDMSEVSPQSRNVVENTGKLKVSPRSVKCVVVGDREAETTCMLITYTTGKYPGEFIPTVFVNEAARVIVDGMEVELDLWDTQGQEEFDKLRLLSYPQTDVFLVCFSIMAPSSFDSVSSKWIPEIRHHCPEAPVILVGTNLDSRDNYRQSLSETVKKRPSLIKYEQGQKLSNKIQAKKYLECSALTQQGLRRVFEEAVRAVIEEPDVVSGRQSTRRCALF